MNTHANTHLSFLRDPLEIVHHRIDDLGFLAQIFHVALQNKFNLHERQKEEKTGLEGTVILNTSNERK